MGGATSSARADVAKYKAPVTEVTVLIEQCQELEQRIAESPEALRYCKHVFETYKASEDNLTQLEERKAKILEAFTDFQQLCTPSVPKTCEELIERASTSLNLSAAPDDPEETAGHLYVFGLAKLQTFPALSSKENLQVLTLKANAMKQIKGSALSCLVSLHFLDLSMNQLESLPEEIGNLSSLKELRASENNLGSLPETFGNLKELKVLILYKNLLSELPKSFGGCLKLEEVNLFNNKLIKIDPCFAQFSEIRDLNLGGNKLKTLPSTTNWTKIERLALSWNSIVVLNEFRGMIKLQQLQLNRNQLSELPESALSDSKDLEVVDLSSNRLETLPNALCNCPKLESLNLSSNQLCVLGDFSPAAALKILNLSSNKLTTIDGCSLHQCKSIITLLLNSNQLKSIPAELTQLTDLQRCNVAGNPEIEVADEIIQKLSDICTKNKGRWMS